VGGAGRAHDDVGTRACTSNKNTCPRADDHVTHSKFLRTATPPVIGAILLAAAACSTLPAREWPPHDERTLVAEYAVHAGEPIDLPMSGPDLTILEFAIEPAPARTEFAAGRRRIEAPPGCARVTVHCHYRAYAHAGAPPAPPEALFPGAAIRLQP
jgi:hypothetical protein